MECDTNLSLQEACQRRQIVFRPKENIRESRTYFCSTQKSSVFIRS